MNREDMIRMAIEAGWDAHHAEFDTRIQAFADLVASAEREACAKVIKECNWPKWADATDARVVFAEAIQARGQA